MSNFECGGIKYENFKYNAFWTKTHIDTKMWPSVDGCTHYSNHIKDCISNPTIGFLTRRQYIAPNIMNYPEYAKRNIYILNMQPEIKALNKQLYKKINTLYNKTKYARQYIINDKRISLNYVTKSKQYTNLDKTIIFIKKLFHHL